MAPDLKILEKQRASVRGGVTRACNVIKDELENATVISEQTLYDAIAQLNSKEIKLEAIDNQIVQMVEEDELDQELAENERYNERLVHWRSRATRYLDEKLKTRTLGASGSGTQAGLVSVSGNTANQLSSGGSEVFDVNDVGTVPSVRLPKLEIKRFDGSLDQWQAFWTQFESAIHCNRKLSSTDKFNYLKSYLKGAAEIAIEGLTLTEENYLAAVEILINRFGRKDLQVSARLNNFLKMSPVLKSTDVVGLRNLHDTCQIEVRNLNTLGHLTDSYGELLSHIVGGLLPLDLLQDYTRGRDENKLWKIKEILDFLSSEIRCRERALAVHRTGPQQNVKVQNKEPEKAIVKSYQNDKRYPSTKPFSAAALNTGVNSNSNVNANYQRNCAFCEKTDHPFYTCTEIPIPERRAIVNKKKLCYLCLKPGHPWFQCRGRIQNCRNCKKRHHQSLCEQGSNRPASNNNNSAPVQGGQINVQFDNQGSQSSAALTTGSEESSVILLQTARADISDRSGGNVRVRCVLDGASHRSFIQEQVSQKLELEVVGTESVSLFAFESTAPIKSKRRRVKVALKNVNTGEQVEIIALETPTINGAVFAVPGEKVRSEMRNRNLELSDLVEQNSQGKSSPIDVLIGADYFWRVAHDQMERLTPDLMAINTVLGWTVQGRSEGEGSSTGVNTVAVIPVAVCSEEKLVSDQLRDFWNLESLGIQDGAETKVKEQEAILDAFRENIKFKGGRYEVALPWKPNKDQMGDNLEVAKIRTNNLVRKLEANPTALKEYDEIIKEQLRTGIIEKVENKEISAEPSHCYYIPHRGVTRESSETTKLRIVNDASSHAKNSPSLNDCMESGPNLLPELFKILVRFRQHRIGVTGDVEKAFHQILVAESDRDALRFFWIKGLSGPERKEWVVYRFTRIPFGCTASPFLLAATIKYHIKKYSESHPLAYATLNRDLYVDDLVSGSQGVREVDQLIEHSSHILREAGMNLRKFHSNSKEIREKWGEKGEISIENPPRTKVLGLNWDEKKDSFSYDVSELLKFLITRRNTKRWVLQAVARIFDPLGLLSPFVIRAKLLFQEMWRKGLQWDQPLDSELAQKFDTWCAELSHLHRIEIPRYYFSNELVRNGSEIEMHGFVDASTKAYAAVVYVKCTYPNGEACSTMVAAKARVAPLEAMSLPRLELMGGVLGARLMKTVLETLEFSPRAVHMWTDSTIVLHWVRDNAARWKPFVSNRVREIQALIEPSQWDHVAGIENPADLPSRGNTIEEIRTSQLWLHGPPWLSEGNKTEVEEEVINEENPVIKVEKKTKVEASLAILIKPCAPIMDLEKYSSAALAFKVTAWVKRYVVNFIRVARNIEKVSGPLSAEELDKAEKYWVKISQEESYPEEINSLKAGVGISKTSKILSLSPVIDEEGLLRLGGRLDAANISYQERHPWILSHKSKLTELLIDDCHIKLKHAGVDDVLTEIREKFWINKVRRVIKSEIQKCPKCKRFRAKAPVAIMAPLPSARINPAPPFSVTGVDFAGPLFTKDNHQKCYIALFTCAVTRAVHLELVSDLSTDKFLMSFRRFIARRGIVEIIYSDNAKTFKKAESDLNELIRNLRHPDVVNYFGSLRIRWRYIADRGSWWGGFWERVVRTVKSSLRKTLGKARLTYEELETLLIEIEATINSRPISYVYDGPGEPAPLTPAHFLIGRRLTSLPSQNYLNSETLSATKEALTSRLKYRQTLLDRFWLKWKNNYLLELRSAHHRPNCTPSDSLKINDVVLIEESKLPRLMWKVAVVAETMVGRDGVVRSCMVRLPNGNRIRRPIQLLYPLEL